MSWSPCPSMNSCARLPMLSSAPNTAIISALGSVANVGSYTLRTLEPCAAFLHHHDQLCRWHLVDGSGQHFQAMLVGPPSAMPLTPWAIRKRFTRAAMVAPCSL